MDSQAETSLSKWQDVLRAERASIAAARQAEDIPRPAGPDGADIPQDAMIGLAFSGGGIRSATFNLGVLQALAKTGWLQQMDYLSTVSGGGYIGSWLSALKRRLRPKETINQTLTDLQGRAPAIQFLREYSNYLTPKTGLFSLDTLSAVVTYGRNLVLNQFVLLCFLTALLLCPHMLVAFAGYAATYPGGDMMSLAVAVLAAIFSARQARDTVNDGLQAAKPAAASTSVALLLIFVYAVSILALSRLKQGNLAWHELSLTPFLLICSPAYALYWAILAHGFTQLNNRGYRRSVCWALLAGLIGGGGLWLMLQALDYLLPVRQEPFLAWHVIGFGFVLLPAAFIMTATAHIGLVKRSFSELQREWWSRLGALLLVSDLALLLVFAMVALALPLVEVADDWIRNAVLPAWLLSTLAAVWQGQSAATSGKEKGDWREWVAKIGPYVFIAGLLLLVSALLSWLLTYFKTTGAQWALSDNPCPDYRCDLAEWASLHFQASHDAGHGGLLYLLLLAASLAVGIFASSRIDINVFSLHNFYRNRLTRCYLGASNRLRSERVNRFTGFCAEDDMAMSELARANPVQRPYHLINTALNLVSGSDLAWQQRKAASFTFSPLYCGYKFPDTAPHPVDVFVRTADYLQDDPSALEAGPMLGSLVATSGAAVSPNQGYHSSPAVSFLLTVFNVRLGRWCPNPNRASAAQLREMSPPVSWRYLLDELFGRTNAESGFVYLSDGGHFENLGIYELARRECALIIACDAGQDENMTFEDLGNAIRKCRIDLGAEIRIDVDSIRIDATTGYSPSCCQMGDIFYASGKRGRLLYLKPCLRGHGAEPVDVLQYKAANPSFPHQSTLNQWFDESQFESYRKLGLCIGETALAELSRPARAPDAADPA